MNEDQQILELKVYKALMELRPHSRFSLIGEPSNEEDYLAALKWQSGGTPPSWSEIEAHIAG